MDKVVVATVPQTWSLSGVTESVKTMSSKGAEHLTAT